MLWNENGRHLLDSLHSSLVIYAHTVKIKIKDQRSRLEENCKNSISTWKSSSVNRYANGHRRVLQIFYEKLTCF